MARYASTIQTEHPQVREPRIRYGAPANRQPLPGQDIDDQEYTIEVFAAGTHTDSAGNTRTWTPAELEKIVLVNNSLIEEVPAVLGHPENGAPAMGWVKRWFTDGNILYAVFHKFQHKFMEAVRRGLWRYRSISIDFETFEVYHVGWLGAQLPAVKGLADVEFSAYRLRAKALGVLTFTAENATEQPTRGTTPMDEAQWNEMKTLLEGIVTAVQGVGAKQDAIIAKLDGEAPEDGEEATAEANTEAGTTSANSAIPQEFSQRVTTLEQQNRQLQDQLQESRFNAWLDSPEVRTRVTPAMRPSVLATMKQLSTVSGVQEFAGGRKVTALQSYQEQLMQLPEQVNMGEIAPIGGAFNFNQGAPGNGGDGQSYQDEGSKIAKAGRKLG